MKYITINILHPFLVAVFPILFLFSHNISEVNASQTIFPLILNLVATLILLVLLNFILKDILKTALIVSTLIFLFYSYGHLLNFAISLNFSINDNYNLIIFPFIVIILFSIILPILKTKRNLTKLSHFLNIIFALLISFQLLQAGYFRFFSPKAEAVQATIDGSVNMPSHLPDIFYLILDGFGRDDILRDIYHIDNSDFLNELRKRGFYIADSSHSNYGTTLSSITSAFNLDYIHRLADIPPDTHDLTSLSIMLANNRVFRFLKQYGYKSVAFESGNKFTELDSADYYFAPEFSLSEFENFLINLTPIPFFVQSGKNQFDIHRDRIEYVFNKLGELHYIEEPKIVFAPIISPHPPFVFGRNGEKIQRNRPFSYGDGNHYNDQGGSDEEYIKGYGDQCLYISQRLIETIDRIFENSKEPPIIILQGDHGPGLGVNWEKASETDMHERFSILNAYHLPRQGNELLNPSITPINSFRIILNRYFGTDFEMLPNYFFFTWISQPYRFIDITDHLREIESGTEVK